MFGVIVLWRRCRKGSVSGIWQVCRVIGCRNKVYQCRNHNGHFSTARLNAVSPRFSGEPLEVPLCPFPPSASLILPFWQLSASFLSLVSLSLFFFLILCWLCFHLLAPFCSRLFCFLRVTSVYVYLSRCLCLCHSSLSLCLAVALSRQVVRRGFTRLRETRDEKRSVRVTIHFNLLDMSCDILKDVMMRTH